MKQYRSLENQGTETRRDDILRAAVCAFVALTQPLKRDCNQIEDLALSILPYTGVSTRRFIAAALANSHHAPHALVRRLCDEAADVCAPLLLKSPVLTPLDLTVIVGTQSSDHIRIIAKRQHLPNSVIEALALLDDPIAKARITYGNVAKVAELNDDKQTNLKPVSAHEARELLRQIMGATDTVPDNGVAETEDSSHSLASARKANDQGRLQKLALHNQEGLFITALADLSSLSFARVLKLTRSPTASALSCLLKALDVDANAAFVMCSVFYPSITSNRMEIRLFFDRYASMDANQALDMVRGWKAEEISQTLDRLALGRLVENKIIPASDISVSLKDEIDWDGILKAS